MFFQSKLVKLCRPTLMDLKCVSFFIAFGLVTFSILSTESTFGQDDYTAEQIEFFEKKIRPVLVDHCYSCHSKNSQSVKGGLTVDTREAIREGGDSGHAVVPGEIENSLLIDAIRYQSIEMPPKKPLPESVIQDFETWIQMGAPDPRNGPKLIKRKIDFQEAKSHWAFQRIANPSIPIVKDAMWPKHDIDRFILAELEIKNLRPVGDASKPTLLRRVYFDLIGIAPTSQELDDFLADESKGAFERVVDRLLASSQFGERWGRHWLDVVRYAESNGRERNFLYPNAWRYRDYVIDSFNQDIRFDQFLTEQVAGDLMDSPTNETLIATGMLAIGPKLLNENNRAEFQMDMVDEQVDVTTRAFMALTVSCARCHDHKFDPIPTSEYYSMAGIFRSTETLYGTKKTGGNRQPSELVSLSSSAESQKANEQRLKVRMNDLENQIQDVRQRLQKLQRETQASNRKKNKTANEKKRVENARKTIANLRKRSQALTQSKKQLEANGLAAQAMGVRDGKVGDSPIYLRGEVSSPKGKAPRGFLTILDRNLKQPILKTKQSGRLELANWMADFDNPLTSRVIVNRVWQHLFGSGIVSTVDNFGATGDAPSHPELLDHLATRFKQEGWSIKTLIRKLVLTRTYQLASIHDEKNFAKDPDNRLHWRRSPQRIDAEALRDTMLSVSGKLDLTPPAGSPISNAEGEYGRQTNVTTMIRGHVRRSVYLPIIRNAVPESLKLFDFAEPSIIVGNRAVTTVPTQALFFLNSLFVTEQCDSFAAKLLNDPSIDDEQRITLTYKSLLSRLPSQSETERAIVYLDATEKQLAHKSDGPTETHKQHAWSSFIQALFGTAEFRYID